MEKNRMDIPEFSCVSKTKPILSITFGILSVIFSALGSFHWALYFFGIGFALASIMFSVKYFEMRKTSIVALVVSVTSVMIIGFAILLTAVNGIKSKFTTNQNPYGSMNEEYFYGNYDYFFSNGNGGINDFYYGDDNDLDGFNGNNGSQNSNGFWD